MKIFLSWSGERSQKVAQLLDEWLSCVMQTCTPWISTKGIESGSIWFNEIQSQLQDTSTGIVCLTPENKNNPWILFEAGALTKGLSDSRVCTLLIGLTPSDVTGPLAQLNHTVINKVSIYNLFRTVNSRLSAPLEEKIFDRAFNTYWDEFSKQLLNIEQLQPDDAPEPDKRTGEDMLGEVLELTRHLSNRVNSLEKNISIATVNTNNAILSNKELKSGFARPLRSNIIESEPTLSEKFLKKIANEHANVFIAAQNNIPNSQNADNKDNYV